MIAYMLNNDANLILIDLINTYLSIGDGSLNNLFIENMKAKINIDFANNELIPKLYHGGIEFIINFIKQNQPKNLLLKKCLQEEESKKFLNEKIYKVVIEPLCKNIIENKEFQEYCLSEGIKLNQIIERSKQFYTFFEIYNFSNRTAFSKELQITFQEFKKNQEIFIALITIMKFYNIKFNISD